MKQKNIVLIVAAIVIIVVVFLIVGREGTGMLSEAVVTTDESVVIPTESGMNTQNDTNTSVNSRTTINSTGEGVDQDCDDTDCQRMDADSDNDSVPADDSASQAEYDGYIQLGDVKGESREE